MILRPELNNRLLAKLSPSITTTLLRQARSVLLPNQTQLYFAGETSLYTYFLDSGLASVIVNTNDGSSAEVAMVGREGMVGAFHLLGPAEDTGSCFMQSDGSGYQIPTVAMQALFEESHDLRTLVLQFAQSYTFTLEQVACCRRHHHTEARLARWLLMAQDRLQTNDLQFTQEVLAMLIGATRPTVTIILGELERNGMLQLSRGKLTITDRSRLESMSCECYRAIKLLFDGLYEPPN